jgi:peptide/nickel transport system permease protein
MNLENLKLKRYYEMFRSNVGLLISSLILLLYVFFSIFAPFITPYSPLEMHPAYSLEGPGSKFIMGTDEFGRDLLSRIIYGSRISLLVATGAVMISSLFGISLGLMAGYFGKLLESIIMRFLEFILCFPPIIIAVIIAGLFGHGLIKLILVIGILYTPYFGRLTHSTVLSLKNKEFVSASIALGAKHSRIIKYDILPNILAPIIVQMSLTFAWAILLESGLSFLGLGVVPPTPSLGQIIGHARGYIYISSHYFLFPSIVIAILIFSINIFGDRLRDLLDPRLKNVK